MPCVDKNIYNLYAFFKFIFYSSSYSTSQLQPPSLLSSPAPSLNIPSHQDPLPSEKSRLLPDITPCLLIFKEHWLGSHNSKVIVVVGMVPFPLWAWFLWRNLLQQKTVLTFATLNSECSPLSCSWSSSAPAQHLSFWLSVSLVLACWENPEPPLFYPREICHANKTHDALWLC